jgi:hypothetical protein
MVLSKITHDYHIEVKDLAATSMQKVEDQIKNMLSSCYKVEDIRIIRLDENMVTGYIRVKGKRSKEDYMKDFVARLDDSGTVAFVALDGKEYKK